MTEQTKRIGPPDSGSRSKNPGEKFYPQYTASEGVHVAVDGQVLTSRDWAIWWDGFTCGRAEGIARGRELADAEAAARHAAAARVVLANLGVERDREADKRRAERSAAYWAARRGEGGTA